MHRQNVYNEVLLTVSNVEHEKHMKQQIKMQENIQRKEEPKEPKISKIIKKKKEKHESEVKQKESPIPPSRSEKPVVAIKKSPNEVETYHMPIVYD